MAMLIGLTTSLATPVSAQGTQYDAGAVRAACSVEWGAEYEMVAYCIERRREGFSEYRNLLVRYGWDYGAALSLCESEWGQEWEMVAYCARQRIEAVSELAGVLNGLPAEISGSIRASCSREWGDELEMVTYCARQRANGWRAINN